MTDRVSEILSWYGHRSPSVRGHLYRMMMTGRLAGTGKFVILPVDQGFEHGPLRSFIPNPAGFNPLYHPTLAVEAGCNAYAAPLGFMETAAEVFAGRLPMILKVNNHEILHDEEDPIQAITASVDDALRLGCDAIGFTIYPGSAENITMYEELRELTEEAHSVGLAVVVWSYPRGGDLKKDDETAVDVACYAAHLSASLGADIIKVKPPTEHIAREDNKKVLLAAKTDLSTLAKRVQLVVKSAFDGHRIVIFSGGATGADEKVLGEIRGIYAGGGFGSIIGRNSFQREKKAAVKLLNDIMDIYAGKGSAPAKGGAKASAKKSPASKAAKKK